MDLENVISVDACWWFFLPKFRSPFAPKQGNFFKATRKTNFNLKVFRKFYSFQVRMAALTGLSLLRLASRGSRLMVVNSRATISSTPGKLLSQSHSRFVLNQMSNLNYWKKDCWNFLFYVYSLLDNNLLIQIHHEELKRKNLKTVVRFLLSKRYF
jgi:hypothetical protein